MTCECGCVFYIPVATWDQPKKRWYIDWPGMKKPAIAAVIIIALGAAIDLARVVLQ